MKIRIEPKPGNNVHGFKHRLWLDNYYQDLTEDDLQALAQAAADAAGLTGRRSKRAK